MRNTGATMWARWSLLNETLQFHFNLFNLQKDPFYSTTEKKFQLWFQKNVPTHFWCQTNSFPFICVDSVFLQHGRLIGFFLTKPNGWLCWSFTISNKTHFKRAFLYLSLCPFLALSLFPVSNFFLCLSLCFLLSFSHCVSLSSLTHSHYFSFSYLVCLISFTFCLPLTLKL